MTARRRLDKTALGAFLSLMTLGLLGCPQDTPQAAMPQPAAPQPSEAAAVTSQAGAAETVVPIGVAAFMREPRQGTSVVEGVVSAVSDSDETIALVGSEEDCSDCSTGCAPLSLPVRWEGPMPAVKEKVRVEGRVETVGGRMIFVANRLERPGSEP